MTQPPGPHGPYVPPGAPHHTAYPPAPNAYLPAPVPGAQPRRPPTALIACAVVLGLALLLGASYVIGRVTAPNAPRPSATVLETMPPATTPTPSATVRAGFTLEGTVLSGPTFTARMPDGWVLAQSNGIDNDGEITKGAALIIYTAPLAGTPEARCSEVIESYRSRFGGTVESLVGNWGRRPTVTKHLVATSTDGQGVSMLATCVDRPGEKVAVMLSVTNTDHVQIATDLVSLLNSWSWT